MMNSPDNGAEMEMIMAGGISGLGGGNNMMIVDEFDDDRKSVQLSDKS